MYASNRASVSLPNDPHLNSTRSPKRPDFHPRFHRVKSQCYPTKSRSLSWRKIRLLCLLRLKCLWGGVLFKKRTHSLEHKTVCMALEEVLASGRHFSSAQLPGEHPLHTPLSCTAQQRRQRLWDHETFLPITYCLHPLVCTVKLTGSSLVPRPTEEGDNGFTFSPISCQILLIWSQSELNPHSGLS